MNTWYQEHNRDNGVIPRIARLLFSQELHEGSWIAQWMKRSESSQYHNRTLSFRLCSLQPGHDLTADCTCPQPQNSFGYATGLEGIVEQLLTALLLCSKTFNSQWQEITMVKAE